MNDYHYIQKYGIHINNGCCTYEDVRAALTENQRAKFHKFFGIQTVCEDGMYACDVEAVLRRMDTGVWSSLDWD